MRRKFELKIILLGILLICFIGITALNKQPTFSKYVVNDEELEDIKMGRIESSDSLLLACVFRLNGTACTLQREGCPLQTGSF